MSRRLPSDKLANLGGLTLGDFWSWAYSDILGNVKRAAFAEFLVAAALGLVDTPSIEWDAVDLRYCGHGIEVKASAYLQTWPQSAPSCIRFDIGKKRGWDPFMNTYAPQATRSAECYVFCLFTGTDLSTARDRILDPAAWEFYVLSTVRLEQELGDQKSVGLKTIRHLARAVPFRELKCEVDVVLRIES